MNGGIYVRRGAYQLELTKTDIEYLNNKVEDIIYNGNDTEVALGTLRSIKTMLEAVDENEVLMMNEWTFSTNFYKLKIEDNIFELTSITPQGLKDSFVFDNMKDIEDEFISLEDFMCYSNFKGNILKSEEKNLPFDSNKILELYSLCGMSLAETVIPVDEGEYFKKYFMVPVELLKKYKYNKIDSVSEGTFSIRRKETYRLVLDYIIDYIDLEKQKLL